MNNNLVSMPKRKSKFINEYGEVVARRTDRKKAHTIGMRNKRKQAIRVKRSWVEGEE